MKQWQLLIVAVAVIAIAAALLLLPRHREPAPQPRAGGATAAPERPPAPPSTAPPPAREEPAAQKPARAERPAAAPQAKPAERVAKAPAPAAAPGAPPAAAAPPAPKAAAPQAAAAAPGPAERAAEPPAAETAPASGGAAAPAAAPAAAAPPAHEAAPPAEAQAPAPGPAEAPAPAAAPPAAAPPAHEAAPPAEGQAPAPGPAVAATPAPAAAAPPAQETAAPQAPAGGWVLGRVRSNHGGPVTRFSVNGRPVSDPNGAFRVDAPRGGTVKVVIRADGFATALVRAGDVRGEKVIPDVVLEPGTAAVAEVVDAADEAPVPKARAQLADPEELKETWTTGEPMTRVVEPAATGPGGMARLERVPPGNWLLLVQHPDYRLELAELRPPDERTRVPLHRGGSLSGHVVGAGGRPLAGTRVTAVSRSALDAADGRTDAQGRFRFGPLHPGHYGVLAVSPDPSAEPLGSLSVEIRDGEAAAADFKARSGGATVRVRILDGRGRAAHADALLVPGDVARPTSLSRLLESTAVYPAWSRGTLQIIASVPAGRHTLLVLRRSGETVWSETVDVPASGEVTLEVRLPDETALSLAPRAGPPTRQRTRPAAPPSYRDR